MSLDYWAEQGWIVEVEVSSEDISKLLDLAGRNIEEALNSTHSDDWKFNILYASLINIATCALRACRFRVKSPGSHFYLIQSLEFTLGTDSITVSLLDSFRKKRNLVTYELEGAVSDTDLQEIEELAHLLFTDLDKWLHDKFPELV